MKNKVLVIFLPIALVLVSSLVFAETNETVDPVLASAPVDEGGIVSAPPASDSAIEEAEEYLRDFLGDGYVERLIYYIGSSRDSVGWRSTIRFGYKLCNEPLVIEVEVYKDGTIKYDGPSKAYQCNIDKDTAVSIAKENGCVTIYKTYVAAKTYDRWFVECRGGAVLYLAIDIETGERVGVGYSATSPGAAAVTGEVIDEGKLKAKEYIQSLVGENYFEDRFTFEDESVDNNILTLKYNYLFGESPLLVEVQVYLADYSILEYSGPTTPYEPNINYQEASEIAIEQGLKEPFDINLTYKGDVEEGDENKIGKDYVWVAQKLQTEETIKGETRLAYIDIETGDVIDVKYFEEGRPSQQSSTSDVNGNPENGSQQNSRQKDAFSAFFEFIGQWIQSVLKFFGVG
ncbi:MAG: hypothetical protein JW744_04170 [Candidatus Diapherotrites archaeon]|uniref:PepSY domain-containing protein n=1 Tax=Candidatus Iainarchaeum sp. TaxID=3101447 RepID=A0A939C930_9ARCH|nr:hypothetical protein [Candidatus Diapherotrites archaeon]